MEMEKQHGFGGQVGGTGDQGDAPWDEHVALDVPVAGVRVGIG